MRLVLDTNAFVSSVFTSHGPPALVLDAWIRGQYDLLVSDALLDELRRVFSYPRIVAYSSHRSERASEIREDLENLATRVVAEVVDADRIVRDPKDQMVLALARSGSADYLVSGDKDLQVLETYAGVQIVSPAQMLDVLLGLIDDA